MRTHLPLQEFGTAIVHRCVQFALGLAQTLGARLVQRLTEEALFRIVAQMLRIVERGLQLQEALHVRHGGGRLFAQHFAVDDVHLLGRIVGQPVFEVLCVLAGVQTAVAQIFERFRGRIAGGDNLWVGFRDDD